MTTPVNLARLNHRHLLAAALVATGATNKDISEALGFSQQYMGRLQATSLFKAEVERIYEQMKSGLLTKAVEMLISETVNNITTLKAIRDNFTLSPHARIKAANSMLDRVEATSTHTRVDHSRAGGSPFTQSQVEFLVEALEHDPRAAQAFKNASDRSIIELTVASDQEAAELQALAEPLAFLDDGEIDPDAFVS